MDAVWWFRVITKGSVFLIGTPGNLLIIGVYATKKNKATPHIFVIGLAVADFIVCLMRLTRYDSLSSIGHVKDVQRVPVSGTISDQYLAETLAHITDCGNIS